MEGDESTANLDNKCTREENRRSLIQKCVGEGIRTARRDARSKKGTE
jgi:hypothetical protein